ncbi:methylmalonyl-CoA mutase family protein [Catalinimonas alkaloidigena]|nr:methylmalonyl-CoA mutase family protein [Catalinimonas alkaloidigena]
MASTPTTGLDTTAFEALSYGEWAERARRELKGKTPAQLHWHLGDDFDVPPYFTQEHMQQFGYLRQLATQMPAAGWVNREELDARDGTLDRSALEAALATGAEGLALRVSSQTDLRSLLAGINLNQVPVSFYTNAPEAVIAYVQRYYPAWSALKGSVYYTGLHQTLGGGPLPGDAAHQVARLHQTFADSVAFCPHTVDLRAYQHAGATAVQEIAFGLSEALVYRGWLEEAGVETATFFRQVEARVAIGPAYLLEIAKLRAFRWLWHTLAAAYQTVPGEVRLFLHARTSEWTRTVADPYVNLLRHTTEAMAAVLGGCQALTVLPYTSVEGQSVDSRPFRLARNVSSILKHESYLDKVADPAAGAYYLEYLTDALITRAWALFCTVQDGGGWLAYVQQGKLAQALQEARTAQATKLQHGERVVVGVTHYRPDSGAHPIPAAPATPSIEVLFGQKS